jgi:site-specific recombinase XerD
MPSCDPWTEKDMAAILSSNELNGVHALRNRALFALSVSTGGRISELLGLCRGDVIDYQGRVKKKIAFTNTKNKCTREVDVVNPFVIPFLKAWLQRQQELGLAKRNTSLFTSYAGGSISRQMWYGIIKRACQECGLHGQYGTHSARKTWARDTYKYYHARAMKGELIDPLLKLQEAGGWKTIEAARRYISFMLGDTTESQEALYPELQKIYGGK